MTVPELTNPLAESETHTSFEEHKHTLKRNMQYQQTTEAAVEVEGVKFLKAAE